MKKQQTVIALVLLASIFFGVVALTSAQDQPIFEAALVSQDHLNLTVYTDSTVLVQDVRTFDLQAGLNEIYFDAISPDADLSSVAFSSADSSVRVLEQSLETPQEFELYDLMEANVGQEITVTTYEEATYSGTLLHLIGGNQLILQQSDGTMVNVLLSSLLSYNVPVVELELAQSTRLALVVSSEVVGPQAVAITFLTRGLSWTADYNVVLAEDQQSLALTGWVTLSNYSPVEFESATVTLAAGNFNQLTFVNQATDFAYSATATALPSTTATYDSYNMNGRSSSTTEVAQPSNFLYTLDQPIYLPSFHDTRIQLLAGAAVDAKNVYVYDVSPRIYGFSGFNTDPSYGQNPDPTVLNFLSFTAQADKPFAAGKINLYQQENDGSALLIGVSQLPSVDPGQEVQIFLESSDDITGERRQTGYQALSADALQEDYEIRLRNNTDQAVTILVPERMTRSTVWEVVGSNTPFEQPNAFGIEFEVEVPAGGEAVIEYSVLYRRP